MSMIIDKLLSVDITNQMIGYIITRVEATEGVFKLKISTDSFSYLYNLNTENPTTIPLQMGNGLYVAELYQNINKNKYMAVGVVEFTVQLIDEFAPFLHSNQYVDYDDNQQIIDISNNLFDVNDIRQYIERNFVYDYIYAVTAKRGVLPNINRLLSSHMGICQDISSLAVALIRLKSIPAKLVIGLADDKYHAWVNYFDDDSWQLYDPTAKIVGLIVEQYQAERIY